MKNQYYYRSEHDVYVVEMLYLIYTLKNVSKTDLVKFYGRDRPGVIGEARHLLKRMKNEMGFITEEKRIMPNERTGVQKSLYFRSDNSAFELTQKGLNHLDDYLMSMGNMPLTIPYDGDTEESIRRHNLDASARIEKKFLPNGSKIRSSYAVRWAITTQFILNAMLCGAISWNTIPYEEAERPFYFSGNHLEAYYSEWTIGSYGALWNVSDRLWPILVHRGNQAAQYGSFLKGLLTRNENDHALTYVVILTRADGVFLRVATDTPIGVNLTMPIFLDDLLVDPSYTHNLFENFYVNRYLPNLYNLTIASNFDKTDFLKDVIPKNVFRENVMILGSMLETTLWWEENGKRYVAYSLAGKTMPVWNAIERFNGNALFLDGEHHVTLVLYTASDRTREITKNYFYKVRNLEIRSLEKTFRNMPTYTRKESIPELIFARYKVSNFE